MWRAAGHVGKDASLRACWDLITVGFGRRYVLRNTELTGKARLRHVHVTIFAVEKQ
jgi:hypothetical protein